MIERDNKKKYLQRIAADTSFYFVFQRHEKAAQERDKLQHSKNANNLKGGISSKFIIYFYAIFKNILLAFSLSAAQAGMIAASFAFINLIVRPLGGVLSDRMGSRRKVMLIYMSGICVGLVTMGFMDSSWPLIVAIAVTVLTFMFVQGAEGATYSIVPMVKKRLTGQVAGMAGAYGNVGSTVYLTMYTFVSAQQFFFILAGGAFVSFVICYFMLEEPKNSFAEEYYLTDDELEQQAAADQLLEDEEIEEKREGAV